MSPPLSPEPQPGTSFPTETSHAARSPGAPADASAPCLANWVGRRAVAEAIKVQEQLLAETPSDGSERVQLARSQKVLAELSR